MTTSNNLTAQDTLCGILGAHAKAAPSQTAYLYLRDGRTEHTRLTYADLDASARAVAAALQDSGIAQGDRVLLLFPAGVEVLIALFGCLYAGVIAVPVPAPEASRMARTLPRLRAIVEDADARGIVSCGSVLSVIESVPDAGAHLGGFSLNVESVDRSAADRWRRPVIGRDPLAYLQYTSGSTSTPKGVCIAHAHLLQHLHTLAAHCGGYSAESVTVNWMPYFHDYGLVEGMLLPLFNRTPCVLMSPYAFIKEPANWLRAISRYRATHSHAPNFAYALCTRRVDPGTVAQLDLSSWTCAGNAAEPINPEVMAAFAKTFEPAGFRYESFYPNYGLAEATLMVSYKERGQQPRAVRFEKAALEAGRVRAAGPESASQDVRTIVACGRPVDGTRVVIVDPETCQPASPDAVGEIWVSSPAVAGGYWQRREATEETFQARLAGTGEGPFLRTGDLGFLHAGELFICGRHKDLIILRGQNISPQDIEWTVQDAHPALRPECGAAFSIEVEGEERLVVAQEVQGRFVRAIDPAEVFGAIRSAVGEAHGLEVYAIALVRPGGISKTSSGKIQRRACRQMFLDGSLNVLSVWNRGVDGPGQSAPRVDGRSEADILEFIVTRVAAAVGQPEATIDPREPFARLGLDSLRTVALIADLETWLGRELPATLGFDYPNALALTRHLHPGAGAEVNVQSRAAEGRQPIAIIGIGCRLPGGICGPEQFWQALQDGFDGVREVPKERWDSGKWYVPGVPVPGKMNTRWGGFVDDVDAFDAAFFAMSPREARLVDPQQRMLLEVTWEALEHAGIVAVELAGSRTGVFVGICSNDYQRLQGAAATLQESYAATGNALSIAANRISYTFDLVGPSWAVDTACSSSLVAVHQACRSLLAGESDLALAAGVNLVLDPAVTVAFSQAGMMSPTGRCRTFSDDADGYVRAEGCGVVVLKRLDDALRAGDRVIAVIRGSAVNQDGRSNGLTAPSGPSQRAVVRAALADAGVKPSEVGYVEAHGTGTPLGDPIELNALAQVLAEGRAPDAPCWVGSVKANIGHLEGAAGIAGLIKAALCVERGSIPRNLHFRSLNPHIRIAGTGLAIPTRTEEWCSGSTPRIAGVSSFGFGGTNAHVIVAAPPPLPPRSEAPERRDHLLCVSARSTHALDMLLATYAARLRALPAEDVADFCYTVNARRSTFAHRAMAVGGSGVELADALDGIRAGRALRPDGNAARGKAPSKAPPVAFLFGDADAASCAMGAQLFLGSPVFADSVKRCLQHLDADAGSRLMRCLGAEADDEEVPARSEQALYGFVVQYAAWALWCALGVRPAVLYAEKGGLAAAACAAGSLALEDGLRLCAAADPGEAEQMAAAVSLRAPEAELIVPQAESANALARTLAPRLHHAGARREFHDADGNVLWIAMDPHLAAGAGPTGLPHVLVARLDADTSAWAVLLGTLGRLFVAGIAPDWKGLYAPGARRHIDVPTYPFERQRYWFPREQAEGRARDAAESIAVAAAPAPPREVTPSAASETASHVDWLALELARLEPSRRRRLLEPFLEEVRHAAAGGPRGGEAPLSSADIQRLSEEEAEAVLRRRLESMNY